MREFPQDHTAGKEVTIRTWVPRLHSLAQCLAQRRPAQCPLSALLGPAQGVGTTAGLDWGPWSRHYCLTWSRSQQLVLFSPNSVFISGQKHEAF